MEKRDLSIFGFYFSKLFFVFKNTKIHGGVYWMHERLYSLEEKDTRDQEADNPLLVLCLMIITSHLLAYNISILLEIFIVIILDKIVFHIFMKETYIFIYIYIYIPQ